MQESGPTPHETIFRFASQKHKNFCVAWFPIAPHNTPPLGDPLDTIIVGAGPAGLSAALVLARCRRNIRIFDSGSPRNAASRGIHNFLTRDGIKPRAFRDTARRELARLGIRPESALVSSAARHNTLFSIQLATGQSHHARTLLLATGVTDQLPTFRNARAFYGQGLHHCPYCDGFTYRDRAIAASGPGKHGLGLAINLLTWSPNITLLTDARPLDRASLRKAAALGITVRTQQIAALLSARGKPSPTPRDPLGRVTFTSGPDLLLSALFFHSEKAQRSTLPQMLGCRLNDEGGVIHDARQRTGIPGLYLAGDASFDVQFVIVACAEGAKAAVAINRELQDRDRAAALERALARAGRPRESQLSTRPLHAAP